MTLTPRSQIIDTEYIDINDLIIKNNINDKITIKNDLNNLFFVRKYKNMTNNLEVSHYGIDYDNMIHDEYHINKLQYDLAIYLITSEIINMHFKNDLIKFVMIDFFYHDDKKNENNCHTTTLYKHLNDNEIKIFDPNNHEFSEKYKKTMDELNLKYCLFNLQLEFVRGQIYNPHNNTDCEKINGKVVLKKNYDNNIFLIRDCTNIALIICYELYELAQDLNKTAANIIDEIKRKISNQKRSNKNIADNLDGTLLRGIHSSDKSERENELLLLKNAKNIIQKCEKEKIRTMDLQSIDSMRLEIELCEQNLRNLISDQETELEKKFNIDIKLL
jgi:hypothetical protein